MIPFLLKAFPILGEAIAFLRELLRKGELDKARHDGQNEQIIKDMRDERNIETRFDKAQGAINEASHPVSNDTVRDRLRNNKF